MQNDRRGQDRRYDKPLPGVGITNAASAPMLGFLSAAAQASFRAGWWTRQVNQSFTTPTFDSMHLYDQSGNGRTLTSAAALGTASETGDVALVFDPLVPNTFTRGDVLGLAADPALTIVWKAKLLGDYGSGTFPTLLALGADGNADFNLYFDKFVGNDIVTITNFASDQGVDWQGLTSGVLAEWHNFVLTKPSASGYAAGWKLYIDGVDQGAANVNAGSINLAAGTPTTLVGDYSGGGFPLNGHLAGILVFERVLSGADLTLVQSL